LPAHEGHRSAAAVLSGRLRRRARTADTAGCTGARYCPTAKGHRCAAAALFSRLRRRAQTTDTARGTGAGYCTTPKPAPRSCGGATVLAGTCDSTTKAVPPAVSQANGAHPRGSTAHHCAASAQRPDTRDVSGNRSPASAASCTPRFSCRKRELERRRPSSSARTFRRPRTHDRARFSRLPASW
jgi:hypothetical protein